MLQDLLRAQTTRQAICRVSPQFIDARDMVPTFSALAGARLPERIIIDGHSFAPQLRGEKGQPREWIFHPLAKSWYVRTDGWKLNQAGELFDMAARNLLLAGGA